MAKWNMERDNKEQLYRHVRTGNVYSILHEGLEVTTDDAVESVVYQDEDGDVFIQAKSRFFDGRFEAL